MKPSKNLIEFLLEVEMVSNPNLNQEGFYYHALSHATNKYELILFIQFKNKFQKEDLYSELRQVLTSIGHPVNDEIIDGVVLLFSLSGKASRNENLVNNFFLTIGRCKIKQYMFLSGEQQKKIYMLKFKDFSVGTIDYIKFASFVNDRSGSDYADKYKAFLSNRTGIEIKSFEIKVLDIYKWGLIVNNNLDLTSSQEEIINIYLTAVSNYHINNFKKKFIKQQEFINSYFGLYYPFEKFEMIGCTFVCIFYNFLNNFKAGWVLPIHKYLSKVFFPDPIVVEKVNQFLSQSQNQVYESNSEFSRYLDTVCSIFSDAEKHIHEGNNNHAFVSFFVGLDFLLAPNREQSKILKQRISMLTYTAMTLSFEEQLNRVIALYKVRNSYVHQGDSVHEDDLIELRKLCRVVLSVLLQIHVISLKNKKIKFGDWLSKIDVFVQDIRNGELPSKQNIEKIGIKAQENLYLQNSLDKWTF